ncbi:MAG: SURF1 family protein, partial [Pseudomonadota bacterium]
QFLLDNRFKNHQIGYDVFTPLIIDNSDKVIFIDRGWIVAPHERVKLPYFQTPEGNVTFVGLLRLPSAKQFVLSKKISEAGWPKRIQKIDLQRMAKAIGKTTYPFYLLQRTNLEDNLVREWQPTVMAPERHLGYAMQWFALGLAWFIMCLIASLRIWKKQRDQES